jgi:Fe-S cluster biogenesis protein NfuA
MADALKISGELTNDPSMCHFHLNRPLVDGWTLTFERTEEALGSPLVERLLAVEGIARVQVHDSTITLIKKSEAPWPHIAADISQAIRATCDNADLPPISAAAVAALEGQSMDGVEQEIADLLEERINPALSAHGGFVRLVKVEGHDIYVEMGGGCQGCASSKATMRYGVENAIRQIAPQVRRVIDATDHASGVNPYYH